MVCFGNMSKKAVDAQTTEIISGRKEWRDNIFSSMMCECAILKCLISALKMFQMAHVLFFKKTTMLLLPYA